MRRVAVASLVFVGIAACSWPPSLLSGPNLPNPAETANQAADVSGQATRAVGQTAGALAQSPGRIQAPAVAAPRLGGGGLLRH